MKRKVLLIFIFIILLTIINSFLPFHIASAYASYEPIIVDKMENASWINKPFVLEEVYLGGTPIGLSIDSNGVKVIGISEILSNNGMQCPAISADIRIGDIITKANGIVINNVKTLSKIADESKGNSIKLSIIRNGLLIETKINPVFDITIKKYKLGIWTKEGSSGIGTLTFVRKTGRFASLGHPIVNPENGEIYTISGGTVYECDINGIIKSERGKAGELKGTFKDKEIGVIDKNNKFGVYGYLNQDYFINNEKIEIIRARDVKPGKVKILTTIHGNKPIEYEAEIIKTVNQNTDSDKGIILRITDERLIEKAGGIVQGMSGSPIIQNGKLVGAVTHVFINDSLKGYGVYSEFMLKQ